MLYDLKTLTGLSYEQMDEICFKETGKSFTEFLDEFVQKRMLEDIFKIRAGSLIWDGTDSVEFIPTQIKPAIPPPSDPKDSLIINTKVIDIGRAKIKKEK